MQAHVLLTSVLDVKARSVVCPGRFSPGMSNQYQVNIEQGWKKEQGPDYFGEHKNLPLSAIDLHFLGRPYAAVITIRTKLHEYTRRRYECMNGT